LLRRKLLFSLVSVHVEVAIVRRVPLVLLLRLDLLLNQLDEQSSQRVVIQVAQQAREDLALLLDQQVLQSHHLLLVKELFHDLEEVATKNGQWVLILVQELAQRVH